MRILVASLIVMASSLAHAESLVEKMYELHFESVKETLSSMYGMNPTEITKETRFSNETADGTAMALGDMVYSVVMINNTYQGKNYALEAVMNEFVLLEAREGCSPRQKDENGYFVLDAECISRALWLAKQRRA